MTLEEFIVYVTEKVGSQRIPFRSVLSRGYESKPVDGKSRRMLAHYGVKDPQQKQISVDVVRVFIDQVQKYGFNEAILIIDAPLSSSANKELLALTLTKWQIFYDSDLTYNPTLHVDTPRHELLSAEETREKLREMKVDISKLLIIKINDPIVRYYGWTTGGLVRIHRNDRAISILAPKSINYRLIVG
jgi:DNA-directed RNA polymerase subunit H (RpoH/RPB5)